MFFVSALLLVVTSNPASASDGCDDLSTTPSWTSTAAFDRDGLVGAFYYLYDPYSKSTASRSGLRLGADGTVERFSGKRQGSVKTTMSGPPTEPTPWVDTVTATGRWEVYGSFRSAAAMVCKATTAHFQDWNSWIVAKTYTQSAASKVTSYRTGAEGVSTSDGPFIAITWTRPTYSDVVGAVVIPVILTGGSMRTLGFISPLGGDTSSPTGWLALTNRRLDVPAAAPASTGATIGQ